MNLIKTFSTTAAANFVAASLVTDAQIATPGFLAGFDAFVYTRDEFSFVRNGASPGIVVGAVGSNDAPAPGTLALLAAGLAALGGMRSRRNA